MKYTIFLAATVLAAASVVAGKAPLQEKASADATALAAADAELEVLHRYIGGYPPRFDATVTSGVATERLRTLIATLNALDKERPDTADVEWRLGDAYRMGHNLDLDGAWEAAEASCKKAIAHDSKCYMAYVTLGGLYVESSPELAHDAEVYFKKAKEVAGDRPALLAYRGLVFAYLMQGETQKAIGAADECVRLYPDQTDIAKVADSLRKNPQVKKVTVPPGDPKPHS